MCRPLREGGAGGLQEGSLETLRYLLDPEGMTVNVERNEFLDVFYDKYMAALVKVVTDPVEKCAPPAAATCSGRVSQCACGELILFALSWPTLGRFSCLCR